MENEQGDYEEDRLLACAKKLFRAGQVPTKETIESTGLYSKEELEHKLRSIRKKLKDTFIPRVSHMESLGKTVVLNGANLTEDLQVVLEHLIQEESKAL
mmetsp:Transcript_19550/g.48156  ORF Transcript_19550/g.48156 Transcript_19550/m.48156 type:complete len:99 (-) Transcript_19550:310-606(-)|eukprot:CAMPEP_0113655300 /NCGR_PEP_ID=MMETSP0017_2-20120614/29625_1 /TAXON_ID=2856 /ORGANISM="Cylindrotheca closterium" /LENGTH=98 /DNA_ID=CAMNT_0000568523 /DNA_START=195 /DNA_END=491 /DNA_ORIENTATION=+ /assembly_acc=CAM_ASM_000147